MSISGPYNLGNVDAEVVSFISACKLCLARMGFNDKEVGRPHSGYGMAYGYSAF